MARRTRRVRLLTSVAGGPVQGDEGDEVDLPDHLVQHWVDGGVVEVVREPGRAPRGGERAVKAPKGEQR